MYVCVNNRLNRKNPKDYWAFMNLKLWGLKGQEGSSDQDQRI